MTQRLLVTGYGGFVAGSVVLQGAPNWAVTAVARSPVQRTPQSVQLLPFDLRDLPGLNQAFDLVRPDVVVHAAAMSNIDRCQQQPAEATQVNVDVTRSIAEQCGRRKIRLVFCSTDAVFDGTSGMYREDDAPSPLNHYAETKVIAERLVLDMVPNSVVARLALVMGLPLIGAGNAFVANMRASFAQGQAVTMPANEVRTPIDVVTLGRALLELAGNSHRGFVHLAGNSRLDRHAMGVQIAKRFGYSADLVLSTNSNAIPERARRPDDASLDNSLAKSILSTPMLDFMDGLDLALNMAEKPNA